MIKDKKSRGNEAIEIKKKTEGRGKERKVLGEETKTVEKVRMMGEKGGMERLKRRR